MRRRGKTEGSGSSWGVLPPAAARWSCYLAGIDIDLLGIRGWVISLTLCLSLSCVIPDFGNDPGWLPRSVIGVLVRPLALGLCVAFKND